MMFLYLTVVIIQLIYLCNGVEYVVRYIDKEPRRCLPIYNCTPGFEILPCPTEFTKEKCSPCYDDPDTRYNIDFVQPDYISSVDDLTKLRCFKPLVVNGRPAVCTGHDLSYDKVDLGDKIACMNGRGCKCNLNKCFFGDPCYCDNYRHTESEGCRPGYHLNNSGACVPCPAGFVKNESGCGPCLRVPSNATVSSTTTKASVSIVPTTPASTKPTTTPKPKTTTQKKTSTTAKAIVTPKPRGDDEENSTTPIIIGIIAAVVFLIIILIVIIILYRKGKCRTIKIMLDRDRRNVPNERNNQDDEEQPLQLENIQNEINHIHIIERQNSAGNKPNNNNLTRIDSDCPSERFDSTSTVSINRQLSNISDRINSNTSENSPLLKVAEKGDFNPHFINRINSVPNPSILHRDESLPNPQELNRAVSVPQQASENGDFGRYPSHNNSTSQLVPSPTSGRQPFLDTMGGGIPPLDFDNIQTSNPVMNTELPNICEFKRSLSKDSSSSMDLSSSSPLNSVPEETGKEIQEEVAEDFNISGVVPERDISNNNDYSDCHLSTQFADEPRDSDITNQIDSRLEQYNHTVTGTEDGATCSVQRLPSEHEEETMKKKDLESNLDSGMVSNCSKGSDLSKSDSV